MPYKDTLFVNNKITKITDNGQALFDTLYSKNDFHHGVRDFLYGIKQPFSIPNQTKYLGIRYTTCFRRFAVNVLLLFLRSLKQIKTTNKIPAPISIVFISPLLYFSYFAIRSAAIIAEAVTVGTPPPGWVDAPA